MFSSKRQALLTLLLSVVVVGLGSGVVLAYLKPAPADVAKEETLIGSGKEATKEIKVTDFDVLEVRLPMRISISQAEAFKVVLSGDDNLLEAIETVKKGSTLKISSTKALQPNLPLRAAITLPTLEGVDLSTSAQVMLTAFKSTKDFQAKLSGSSLLAGSLEAGNVEVDASGSSTVKLKGSAKKANLAAARSSSLELGGFAVQSANVKLTASSSAKINVTEKLDYVLGASTQLEYEGNPTVGTAETASSASVSRSRKP